MTDESAGQDIGYLGQTTDIVAAYLGNNTVKAGDIAAIIQTVQPHAPDRAGGWSRPTGAREPVPRGRLTAASAPSPGGLWHASCSSIRARLDMRPELSEHRPGSSCRHSLPAARSALRNCTKKTLFQLCLRPLSSSAAKGRRGEWT